MLIAAEAYVAVREAAGKEIDAAVVALAWERACSHDAERCRLVIERMRRLRVAKGSDLALRLARALAGGEPPYSVGAHAEQVKRVLTALADIGVVEQLGRGAWEVSEPILRAYLVADS
jgi:hypothetical protein